MDQYAVQVVEFMKTCFPNGENDSRKMISQPTQLVEVISLKNMCCLFKGEWGERIVKHLNCAQLKVTWNSFAVSIKIFRWNQPNQFENSPSVFIFIFQVRGRGRPMHGRTSPISPSSPSTRRNSQVRREKWKASESQLQWKSTSVSNPLFFGAPSLFPQGPPGANGEHLIWRRKCRLSFGSSTKKTCHILRFNIISYRFRPRQLAHLLAPRKCQE